MPTSRDDRVSVTALGRALAAALVLSSGVAVGRSLSAAEAAANIADLPPRFAQQTVATGLTGATGMTIAPDGRIFICEQTGTLRLVKDGTLLSEPVLSLAVDSSWERGLIGVALDPAFEQNGYLYIVYVAAEPYPHHRVSRFTLTGDRADPKTERLLLAGDDQTKMGGAVPAGHQGGGIQFGANGKLYIAIGEQTAGAPSQKLDTLLGKLLRINPNGSIPEDNPFYKTAKGKYRAIWCYGLRNPFAFAVQPGTGRMFINDVGGSRYEEINEAERGANYGWPITEGPTTRPEHKSPLYAYSLGGKQSIAGGVFYNPQRRQFPDGYQGKYFFAEYMHGWIQVLDPARPQSAEEFANGLPGPVDLRVGPDGSLYVLCRNAWVKDDKFQPNTGSLARIVYVDQARDQLPRIEGDAANVFAIEGEPCRLTCVAAGESPLSYQWLRNGAPLPGETQEVLTLQSVTAVDDRAQFSCVVSNRHGAARRRPFTLYVDRHRPARDIEGTGALGASSRPIVETVVVPPDARDLPRLLSQTGIFRSLETQEPMPGVIPYDVNTPLWSDGAMKRRWMILPDRQRIDASAGDVWKFPAGTVFVKHFEFGDEEAPQAARRRLETRVLVVDRRGLGHGATYRWRKDGSDAELLDDAYTEDVVYSKEEGAETHKQKWTYPSRQDCLACHTAAAGFVLGVNARQLHRDFDYDGKLGKRNQLAEWTRMGMFDRPLDPTAIRKSLKLAALDDERASLAHRARSYLDANCANCHLPGGVRGEFDARITTPLAKQGLIGGKLVAADLGIDGAKVVTPGDRNKSMLYLRMIRRELDAYNMPPLGSHVVDLEAAELIGQWIDSLASAAVNSDADGSSREQASTGIASGTRSRFVRLHWFEMGLDQGNPPVNGRFRVNAPEAVLHPEHGSRQEAKGNGMLLVRADEDPRKLAGAELYCELWGGHPGTNGHRVTINGRSTYGLNVPGNDDCTHLYPTIPLKLTDLVNGYNALQFACDTGTTFWGHFIVDNACLRAELRSDDAALTKHGLNGFLATVDFARHDRQPERYPLSLRVSATETDRIAAVHFQGHYDGYDENGDGRTRDWHGFTKRRQPTAMIATVTRPPFEATWDVSMLPAQTDLKVRGIVEFKDLPGLNYETAAVDAPELPKNRRGLVSIHHAADLPHPFWSRANKKQSCTIDLPFHPGDIDRAELHVVVWDGGAGDVEKYFTLNGKLLPVADKGRHDVHYRRVAVESSLLRQGKNTIELLSDTDHHGIEVLLPGPAILIRTKHFEQ